MRNIAENVLNIKNDVGITISNPFKGLSLIDMGVETPGSWSAAKALIKAVISGLGEINFGEFSIGGYVLPSIDIYFDNPVKSRLPESKKIDGRVLFFHEDSQLIFVEGREVPSLCEMKNIASSFKKEENELTLVATSEASLAAAIYECSMAVPRITEQLLRKGISNDEVLWAWSTTSLPPLADDVDIVFNRIKAALEYGTISSFWVRTDDDKIKQILSAMDLCGELRIHNLRTARTFATGCIDETRLKEIYNL